MTDVTPSPAEPVGPAGGERADLLEALAKQRQLLCFTTRELTDDEARAQPTAGVLCLGGLIKHVAAVERNWVGFVLTGPSAMGDFATMTEADFARRADEFRLLPDETLAGVLAEYAEVGRRTDEVVATVDLDATRPLPSAPWFAPGASWSARRVFLHVLAETAQHAGHADIIRETLDGAKSMG